MELSPQGATEQTEDHRVELNDVTMIELTIVPDISGGSAGHHWPPGVLA